MNKHRFANLEQLRKQFNDEQILTIVDQYLDGRDKRKMYNKVRNAAIRELREKHPDEFKKLMQ